MKSWKKRLISEFDASTPDLKNDVLNAPIVTANTETAYINGNVLAKRKIGVISLLSVAIVLLLLFSFLWIFGVFGSNSNFNRFAFSLEINPAVSFVTDENGIVKNVTALNEDADVILSDENVLSKLKNVTLSKAVVTYTDCAAKLGYLDVTSEKTAVRLSSSTETNGNLLKNASNELQTYFKTNGIFAVVVEDVISVNELSDRLGLKSTSNLLELTNSLENLSTLYEERVDTNADEENLKNLYDKYIVNSQMLEYIQSELLKNVTTIVSNSQMLLQIKLCNYNIMFHEDNPLHPLPADYWVVTKYSDASYNGEFAELMLEMTNLLAEYENKFGITIDSFTDLSSAYDVYSILSDIDFEELFQSLTLTDFKTSAEKYVGMLKNIGFNVTYIESLLSIPKTVQEYLTQLQISLKQTLNFRAEQYKNVYEQKRNQISDSEYSSFISELTQEYGSLKNFWNKK